MDIVATDMAALERILCLPQYCIVPIGHGVVWCKDGHAGFRLAHALTSMREPVGGEKITMMMIKKSNFLVVGQWITWVTAIHLREMPRPLRSHTLLKSSRTLWSSFFPSPSHQYVLRLPLRFASTFANNRQHLYASRSTWAIPLISSSLCHRTTRLQPKPQIQINQHGVSNLPCALLRSSRQASIRCQWSSLTCLPSHSKEKTHINVVVIGHVDSGKSTTTGKRKLKNVAVHKTLTRLRSLDLQVRRYRQAYHREVREGLLPFLRRHSSLPLTHSCLITTPTKKNWRGLITWCGMLFFREPMH